MVKAEEGINRDRRENRDEEYIGRVDFGNFGFCSNMVFILSIHFIPAKIRLCVNYLPALLDRSRVAKLSLQSRTNS